jgi:hypothetical protein
MTMGSDEQEVLDAERRLQDAADWTSKGWVDLGRAKRAIDAIDRHLPPDLRGILETRFPGVLQRVKDLTAAGRNKGAGELGEAWGDLASAIRSLFGDPQESFDLPDGAIPM